MGTSSASADDGMSSFPAPYVDPRSDLYLDLRITPLFATPLPGCFFALDCGGVPLYVAASFPPRIGPMFTLYWPTAQSCSAVSSSPELLPTGSTSLKENLTCHV